MNVVASEIDREVNSKKESVSSAETILVVSRRRPDTAEDADYAHILAQKWHINVLEIPLLYDLPNDSPIIQRLRSLPKPAYFLAPISARSVKSLLKRLQIPYAGVFESVDSVHIPENNLDGGQVERLEESLKTRWYPIIDASRCAACLECVNYCLFGVYAIGHDSRPFVDQPDACRDGCPACSRVCVQKAIMFPLYEDRSIAGYEDDSMDDMDKLIDIVDQG